MPEQITKNARIFRAGTYPKKGWGGADFVVTVNDLRRIAANTPEVPIIFAHDETKERLDFGKGVNLRVEGDELHATLNLDPEAAPFVEKNGLKSLSAGIPFDLSRLQEISFTRRPHILDMGTFSEECAWFSLDDDDGPGVDDALDLLATFAGRSISSASSEKIKAAHDALANLHPACCPSVSRFSQSEQSADERKIKMGFLDRLLGKSDATDAEKAQVKAELREEIKEFVPAPVDNTAQFAQMQKRIEMQDAELFANRMLGSGRILPTQLATVIAEFSEAAEDDRLAPRIVTFSAGTENKQGTRVDRVKAKYENAQPNRLTEELLPDGHYQALFNREQSGQTEEQKAAAQEKEYQELRARTSLGPVSSNKH